MNKRIIPPKSLNPFISKLIIKLPFSIDFIMKELPFKNVAIAKI